MISSFKQGPGLLTFGTVPFNASAQVESCTVKYSETVETVPPRPTLDGDEVPEEQTPRYSAVLEIGVIQDALATSGLIAYSIDNMGEEVPVVFEPNSTLDQRIEGVICVHPIDIGGTNKVRNSSTVTMRFIGLPTLEET